MRDLEMLKVVGLVWDSAVELSECATTDQIQELTLQVMVQATEVIVSTETKPRTRSLLLRMLGSQGELEKLISAMVNTNIDIASKKKIHKHLMGLVASRIRIEEILN